VKGGRRARGRAGRPVERIPRLGVVLGLALTVGLTTSAGAQRPVGNPQPLPSTDRSSRAAALDPPAPQPLSRLWLVPDQQRAGSPLPRAFVNFAAGVDLYDNGKYEDALPLVSAPALAGTLLADYATYYTGLVQRQLARLSDARATFAALRARKPRGHLSDAALLGEAEVAEAQGDHAAAVQLYEEALGLKADTADAILLPLARSAQAMGDRQKAVDAYARVFSEFPTSEGAAAAESELVQMPEWPPIAPSTTRYALELARADRLFASRRWPQARSAFEALRPHASGDEVELVSLRLAECDYYLRRHRSAREALQELVERGSRRAEASYFYLLATRGLGLTDEYAELAHRLVDEFPDSTWAEDALDNLASYYIIDDQDERAAEVFRDLYARYPNGRHAERAAWRIGWWDYRQGEYGGASRIFADAAARFPHSDYRPSYLYWAARAQERVGDRVSAEATYRGVVADYQNSYYGRLASRQLATQQGRRGPTASETPAPPRPPAPAPSGTTGTWPAPTPAIATPPPTESLIRLLLSLELYDQAQNEIVYAQRVWGDSPVLTATLAWVAQAQGDLRRGITLMKRAFPRYLASGGEQLPREILQVIFPLDHWALIKRYASAHLLDPYLVASLINQESTFVPDIRSHANAIGLMQVLPSTGRRYARKLGIRRFSSRLLTRPEINVRIGTAYFADLVQQFGSVHLALASYNAGEVRVQAWISERKDLAQDEFIDDVPFPETQNYLRRVLGMVEDYRRLYPGDTAAGPVRSPSASKGAPGETKPAAKPPVKPKK
jgi:peptidoglycan lytic transglycosylase